jgi:hypothetical protein
MGYIEVADAWVAPADAPPAFPARIGSTEDEEGAHQAAQARAAQVARGLGLHPLETLRVRVLTVHAEGSLHSDKTIVVKYDRVYAGLPVVDGMIAVSLTRAGQIRGASLVPVEAVAVADTGATVSAEEAAQAAVATVEGDEVSAPGPTFDGTPADSEGYRRGRLVVGRRCAASYEPVAPELVVFIPCTRSFTPQGQKDDFGEPRTAWRVLVSDEHSVREEVLVDAHTSHILDRRSQRRSCWG